MKDLEIVQDSRDLSGVAGAVGIPQGMGSMHDMAR
jgi:hypothetical protein